MLKGSKTMEEWNEPQRPPSPFDLDKRLAIVENQQRDIKDSLGQINHNISKLVWIVVGAVVVGVVNLWAGGGGLM